MSIDTSGLTSSSDLCDKMAFRYSNDEPVTGGVIDLNYGGVWGDPVTIQESQQSTIFEFWVYVTELRPIDPSYDNPHIRLNFYNKKNEFMLEADTVIIPITRAGMQCFTFKLSDIITKVDMYAYGNYTMGIPQLYSMYVTMPSVGTIATPDVLGVIRVGTGLKIEPETGILNVDPEALGGGEALMSLDFYNDGFMYNGRFKFKWTADGLLNMNTNTLIPIKTNTGGIK